MAARYPDEPQPVDPIEVHINHFFDRVVACVNHRRMTVLAEANERRLEMAAREPHRAQKEQELIEIKAEVERKISDNELRELQESILADIEAKLTELRLPQPESRLKFQGESEELEQLILALGDVVEETVPVISQYQQMQRIVAIGKDGKNPGQLYNPHEVAIDDTTNHIYVTEGGWEFARVSIFSERGDFLNSFTHERMKCPRGIAFHRNNVYITDLVVHGVFHFKIEADIHPVAALLGLGSTDGMFNFPTQLSVSDNGDLYIADSENHRIQIVDESLNFKHSISHESMRYPVDVKLTAEEVYILSLTDSPCMHIFSHAGDKRRSIITCGRGMQVTEAWFFCLDKENNLIISDGWDNCIKVFSPNGTHLHSIGQFHDSRFWMNPQGIALMTLKLVVVAPGDEFQLQIFSA